MSIEDDVHRAQKAVRAYFHRVPWPGHNTVAAECQVCNESARISVEALTEAGRLRPEVRAGQGWLT